MQNVDTSLTTGSSEGSELSPVMRLSINEVTTYKWSLHDEVPALKECGINSIGVWRPKLARFGEERGIDFLRESGLSVSSLSWAGGFTGANEQCFEEAIDDARAALELAGELSADCLVLISGGRNGHTVNHARELFVEALGELSGDARRLGVPLAVQPMHARFARESSILTSLDETISLLETCDHPSIKMAFDVYQLWQEPDLLTRIPQIAEHVRLVQLSDWSDPPRSDADRTRLGDGEIPLDEIIQAFLEAGYQGNFEIAIWSELLWNSDYGDLLRHSVKQFEALASS